MTATLTEPPGAPQAPPKARNRILPSPVTGQELVLIGVIAVIWAGLAFATPAFLTAGSIRPLLVATAPIALIGIGMTIVIITGGIDVSVGGAIMVCSVLTAKMLVGEVSLLPAVLRKVPFPRQHFGIVDVARRFAPGYFISLVEAHQAVHRLARVR